MQNQPFCVSELCCSWHAADKSEYLIVHGSYLLCYADVTLKWRVGGAGRLQQLDPIHPDRLADQHAADLLAEQVNLLIVRCAAPRRCRALCAPT